jgi:signal transduction histidine kinase
MVFVVRDITGRKQLEAEKAELESRNRQLQKAESLGRMAGAIAHTFNNQMQVVLGSLEVVDALPPGPEVGLALGRVKQAAERAAEVSRLMLVYLGQTSREQEPQSLAGLCRAAESGLRATLAEGVALELDCPGPGPVISANAEQIGQVLASLVANAREALGDARGAIRISLRTDLAADLPTAHRFPVKWQPQGPAYATLEVADTGSGIAAEDLEKLFDPFFSTRFTGRGLGLSVVLGLVQAHGGAVSVASRPAAGSVFRVHLPVLEVPGIG